MSSQIRVLIAEKSTNHPPSIKDVFTNDRADIIEVDSGIEALSVLSNKQFDLCIFDQQLPGVSGLELFYLAKAKYSGSIVIMIEEQIIEGEKKWIIYKGTGQRLSTPVSAEYFNKIILSLIDQKDIYVDSSNKSKRAFIRTTQKTPICFWVNLSSRDEEGNLFQSSKWHLKGKTTDHSRGGIGIETSFPVHKDQILMFDEKINDHLAGIVRWSSQADERIYRAGIQLV